MSPNFVFDAAGDLLLVTIVPKRAPILVTGSPGGSTIITTTMQVILNVIDHQMSLSDAVSSPRFHHQWLPAVLAGALRIGRIIGGLEGMGHGQLLDLGTRKFRRCQFI